MGAMGFTLLQLRPCLSTVRTPVKPKRFLLVKRAFADASGKDEDELRKAREWLAKFSINTIPRSICSASFSRSSGPGGQNVNKVNSKATLKVPLSSLLPLVPPIIHKQLRSSRYLADRSDTLVIHSDEERKQSGNLESCYLKLYRLVEAAARASIPGETSQEQKDRVQNLKKSEREGRLKMKKLRSSKKDSRRKNKYDD